MFKWLHRMYFAIERWRFGENFGCGRCHHAHVFHDKGACAVKSCPCHEYRISRE